MADHDDKTPVSPSVHDEIVKKLKDRNRRLSHSVWTDEPVLMPKKSVWLEDTQPVKVYEDLDPQPPEDALPSPELEGAFRDPETLEKAAALFPVDYEEPVLPLLHDKRVRKRELSISFDEEGKVQINEVIKKGTKRVISVDIPGHRYAEYRRRSFMNDPSVRRTVTVTVPVSQKPPEATMVMTTPAIREQSKGKSYEDPEFSVTPQAEEIKAAMSSEEEFVREYVPEKERLGRTIRSVSEEVKAARARRLQQTAEGLPPEDEELPTTPQLPKEEDQLIGYEAASRLLDQQIKEAERQLQEEPDPEPIKKFERAPKPRFHKPEFEFVGALLMVGALAIGCITALSVLAMGGLPKPSLKSWLSGSFTENVDAKLRQGQADKLHIPSQTRLEELMGVDTSAPEKEELPPETHKPEPADSKKPDTRASAEAWAQRVYVVGEGSDLRGVCGFFGDFADARTAGEELEAIGQSLEGVDTYAMTVPLSSAYYLPQSLSQDNTDQKLYLDTIAARLVTVRSVDAYSRLLANTDQDIYAKTDHRWLPLGAYYAGQVFAEKAGAAYPELSECEAVTYEGYAGDLCALEGAEGLAKATESFTSYKYGTSAQVYTLDDSLEVTGETVLFDEERSFYDLTGTGCIKVVSGSKDRVLALVTDEYGRQLTPFLTAGFGEIWVIDESLGLEPEWIAEKTGCSDLLVVRSIAD